MQADKRRLVEVTVNSPLTKIADRHVVPHDTAVHHTGAPQHQAEDADKQRQAKTLSRPR